MRTTQMAAALAVLALAACQKVGGAEAEAGMLPDDRLTTGRSRVPAEEPLAQLTEAPSVAEDLRTQRNASSGDMKVVGGDPVRPGTFPAVVGITAAGEAEPWCTGTLIRADVVLTAGHCVCDGIHDRVFIGDDSTKGGAYLRVIEHDNKLPCDDPLNMRGPRDLALLRLERRVNTPVIPIAPASVIDSAVSWRAVGFGAIDANAKVYPGDKREARIWATSNACVGRTQGDSDAAVYGCSPRREIVAGRKGTPDTCNGDSGGPLLVSPAARGEGAPHNQYLVAGVTSRPTWGFTQKCGGWRDLRAPGG